MWVTFIFSLGKILSDDSPLTEYKIDEKSFVVVMVTKVRKLQLSVFGQLICIFWPRIEKKKT